MRNQNGVNENALVIRRTVLHDLSVLVIRRTMQINSRPMEITIYFWKQKVAIFRG